MEPENTNNLKTADKTKYMREYKRKQYLNNPDDIRNKNKAYYYKNKYELSTDDLRKYDIHLPLIAKIRKNLDELRSKNPDFVMSVLEPYIINQIIEQNV